MAAPVVYCLRSALLCIDRQTRTLVSLEPGSTVVHISEEDQRMIVLRSAGRELLAFASTLRIGLRCGRKRIENSNFGRRGLSVAL